MKIKSLAVLFMLGSLLTIPAWPCAAEDVTNSKDYPLFPRLPRFEITQYQYNFDAVDLPNGPVSAVRLEGQKTYLEYWLGDNSPSPGGSRIIRDHAYMVKRLGGVTVYENFAGPGARQGVYKLGRGGMETWVWVLPLDDGQGYRLTVVELGQPPQDATDNEL